MDEIATEQVNARLAWFLAGAYPGGAKRKKIARDFEVSPDTAKGWLNGAGPGRRHFDAMVEKWGRPFLRFVYPTPDAEHIAVMDEIAERLARLETCFGQVDRRENSRLPPEPSAAGVDESGAFGACRRGQFPGRRATDRDYQAAQGSGQQMAPALQRREVKR